MLKLQELQIYPSVNTYVIIDKGIIFLIPYNLNHEPPSSAEVKERVEL